MSITLGDDDRPLQASEVEKRIIVITRGAILDSIGPAIDVALDTVALDTGALRNAIESVLTKQVNEQASQGTMTLVLREKDVSALIDYAEFHWDTGPTGLSFYKKATTPGTKPIKAQEILDTVGRLTQQVVLARLRRARVVF